MGKSEKTLRIALSTAASLLLACGPGAEPQGQFAASVAADGSCPTLINGTYEAVLVYGENSCGQAPGSSKAVTVFFDGSKDQSGMTSGMKTVRYKNTCAVDTDYWYQNMRFVGTFEIASETRYRFRGGVTYPDCYAELTITYTKK